MRNSYAGLVEPWKLGLIRERAHLKRLSPQDREDLTQDLVPRLLDFYYDPHHPSGASERTAFIALIDRRISGFLRARKRQVQALTRHRQTVLASRNGEGAAEPCHELHACTLRLEMQEVMARLSGFERAVCQALARQTPQSQIAKDWDVSRDQIALTIERIRETFVACGFQA
ncbi:MAG: hypothetical protein AMXMBFR7_46040 [Planctomycetota bacterium]